MTTDEIAAAWARYWAADRDMAGLASRTDDAGDQAFDAARQRSFDARAELTAAGAWK